MFVTRTEGCSSGSTARNTALVGATYGLWLNGFSWVFYVTYGEAGLWLEIALLLGVIPTLLHVMLVGFDSRRLKGPGVQLLVLVSIVGASYIGTATSWRVMINLLNLLFLMTVCTVFGCSKKREVYGWTLASYAMIGVFILLYVLTEGHWHYGRLFGHLHPNLWGMLAVSVGVAAFTIRQWQLRYGIIGISAMTLYSTSSRGAMVALGSGLLLAVWWWMRKHGFIKLGALVLSISLVLLMGEAAPEMTEKLKSFVLTQLFRVDDPYRGIGSGLTERTAAWREALDIWKRAPFLGVGYRQHEEMMLGSSSSHNAYLAMLVDTGIIGLCAYVVFVIASVVMAMRLGARDPSRCACSYIICAYAVLGLFERRALNVGNAFSVMFLMTCFYALGEGNITEERTRALQGRGSG